MKFMNGRFAELLLEDKSMKGIFLKSAKTALLFGVLGLILAGCAGQTGTSTRSYEEKWRFVPSVHVEDNSFNAPENFNYQGCSYDQMYAGYWCPVNR